MAYRSSNGNAGSGTSLIVTAPTGIQDGDQLIAIWINGAGAESVITWPAGFTEEDRIAVEPLGATFAVARKTASSESGDYTIQSDTNDVCAAIVAAYSGRANATPVIVPTLSGTQSPSPVSVALTGSTAVAGDDILVVMSQNGGGDQFLHTPPASYTERQERSPGAWLSISLSDRQNVSAGDTGTLTGTLTQAGQDTGYAGFVIRLAAAGAPARTIDSISDATLTHGQTGITVGVSGYAATGKTVKICPTDDVNDAAGVAQTVTAQDASSVTFTAVLNSFGFTTLYLFVLDGGVAADSNETGEVVSRIIGSATLNFTGANAFFDENGDPVEMTGTLYVWRSPRPPTSVGTPDQIITSFATSAAGERSQGINLGSLDDGDTVFYMLFGADGTDLYSAGEELPDYA